MRTKKKNSVSIASFTDEIVVNYTCTITEGAHSRQLMVCA